MLRHRPDHEDEVIGIDRCDAALGDPFADRRGAFRSTIVFKGPDRTPPTLGAPWRSVGEQARGFRVLLRHRDLGRDVLPDLLDRITARHRGRQRRQPFRQRLFEHRLIDVLLALEIVEEVRLRHFGAARDLVECRAAEAIAREDVERRLEDEAFVDGLDARLARRGRRGLKRGCCTMSAGVESRRMAAAFLTI